MDKKLIDYSNQYKDYMKTLEEKSKLFTLDYMMSVIEGFVANYRTETINNKERELLVDLSKLHSAYYDS